MIQPSIITMNDTTVKRYYNDLKMKRERRRRPKMRFWGDLVIFEPIFVQFSLLKNNIIFPAEGRLSESVTAIGISFCGS